MYIRELQIENFRCFEEVSIELNYPDGENSSLLKNVNLFLGANGTGKSSIFQALPLGFLARILSSSGIKAEYWVRRDRSERPALSVKQPYATGMAQIDVKIDDLLQGRLLISRQGDFEEVRTVADLNAPQWERLYYHYDPTFFMLGYGANRRSSRPEHYSEGSRTPHYQRVASLFEDQFGLVPFAHAYTHLRLKERLGEAREILNRLLPSQIFLTEEIASGEEPLFSMEGVLLPFSALSTGFRSLICWAWDMLYQMSRLEFSEGVVPFKAVEGIVIVDEIDLFLHPAWQRTIINDIATCFPNLQFFFSSHSPLVAGGLAAANIYVLEGNRVVQHSEEILGKTVNEILLSDYFNLSSVRAPNTGTLRDAVKTFFPSSSLEPQGVSTLDLEAEDRAAVERIRKMREAKRGL